MTRSKLKRKKRIGKAGTIKQANAHGELSCEMYYGADLKP